MSDTTFDIRQSQTRTLQDQLNSATVTRMDAVLAAINSELTAPGRLMAQATPSLIVTVGSGTVINPNTLQNRILPLINNVQVTFAGGTITFPSTSGTIVVSPGVNASITIGANKFVAVLVQLTSAGLLNLVVGAEASSLVAVIYPTADTSKLSLGYIIVQSNGSSIIQNITNAMVYKSVDVNSFGGTLTSPLPVTSGGTGATSLTSNGVLRGGGTSAISPIPGFTYQGNQGRLTLTDGIATVDFGMDTSSFGVNDFVIEQTTVGKNISFYLNGASPNPWWASFKGGTGGFQIGGPSGPILSGSGTKLVVSNDLQIGASPISLQANGGNLLNVNGGFAINNGTVTLTDTGSSLLVSGGASLGGNLIFTTDALRDIGTPSSGRPQNLYLTATANSPVFISTATGNPATLGALRLGRPELIEWRDQAGTGNNTLGVDTSNNLVYNGVVVATYAGGDLNLNGQLIQSTASTTGTYHSMANTDTGGRTFTLSSTGTGNTEGAGSFILVDVTASNARRMIISPTGDISLKAGVNANIVLDASGSGNVLVQNGVPLIFAGTNQPYLQKATSGAFRILAVRELQFFDNSGPVISSSSTTLQVSQALTIGVDTGGPITLTAVSNILSISGGGYAGILAVEGTSRAGLTAPAFNANAVRSSSTGNFYPIIVGATRNTSTALRVIRGGVDGGGNYRKGEGFSSASGGTGIYSITFNAFEDALPTITASVNKTGGNATAYVIEVVEVSATQIAIQTRRASDGVLENVNVDFIIAGIRSSSGD